MAAHKNLIDAGLRQALRRNDPAGAVHPGDCARLEMFIADRVMFESQFADAVDFLPVPRIMNVALPWPVAIAGTMVLGLALGLFISSVVETQAPSYTLAAAMAGPWHSYMQ